MTDGLQTSTVLPINAKVDETLEALFRVRDENFTGEQVAAIRATGRTIVSASAGSGKTTVMIEKMLRFILSGGKVSEILAVTFTRKAASQMKEKLRKELIKCINDNAQNEGLKQHLKVQLGDVQNADISTIHSFCTRIIRTNFFIAKVDSAFRVIPAEDSEAVAMKNRLLDDLFEQGYHSEEKDFTTLLNLYWKNKKDKALREIFLSLYEKLRSKLGYDGYLKKIEQGYDKSVFEGVCNELLSLLHEKAAYYLTLVCQLSEYFATNGTDKARALCEELYNYLNELLLAKTYYCAMQTQFPKFSTTSSSPKQAEELRRNIRKLNAVKAKVTELYKEELLSTQSEDEEYKKLVQSGEIAAAFAKYLLLFDNAYKEVKKERGLLDYNDLEHLAIEVLDNKEICKQTREKYAYVFVDEYQDVNPVQEYIINQISGDNLFLVGDVKQSIYGFRGSQSKYFVQKWEEFASAGGNALTMKNNFRSSDLVLNAVNEQFSLAMTKQTCSVDYKVDSVMQRGKLYAEGSGDVQVHLLPEEDKEAKKEKKESLPLRGVYSVRESRGQAEREVSLVALSVLNIIKSEISRSFYDSEIGQMRKVDYKDIAILSRDMQALPKQVIAYLSDNNIPVVSAAAINICSYGEIKTLIDILSLIDNAEQDIPLCSALLSSFGDLSVEELSQIRLEYKAESFFRRACKRYASEKAGVIAHKLNRFYTRLERYRTLSHVIGAGELLTEIITDTNLDAYFLSKDNGAACLRRIQRFIDESIGEKTFTVHEFLNHLKALDYDIPFSENGGDNSVKVMTMHASKGLEFPVVIVIGLNQAFQGKDGSEVLIEENYGFAPRYFDKQTMVKSDTLLRRLYQNKQAKNSIADELNLYYVALTRAKHTLHIVSKGKTDFANVKYAKSFAEFTDFSVWERFIVEDELLDLQKQDRTALAFAPDKALSADIMQAFLWKYTSGGSENMPVKSSATHLMRLAEKKDMLLQDEMPFTIADKEEYDASGFSGTDVRTGIAYHAFLENVPFDKLMEGGKRISLERLKALVLEVKEKVKEQLGLDAELLDEDKMMEILQNGIFYRLQGSQLLKEQRFLASIKVKDTPLYFEGAQSAASGEDEIVFQGALDLLAVKGDEAWVVDYKYSIKDAQRLKTDYAVQLRLYQKAVSKILKFPIERVHATIVNIYRDFEVEMF